jgi:two-component system nitrogen regulation sensor histidine kinase NtrY
MAERQHRNLLLVVLSILVPALFLLGWSQASLNLSFIRPRTAAETILLLALSILIFVAFVIFALVLLRILLKLYVERRQQQLGSRFKTKMVVAFLSLSLLPVCFLFAFAYGLLNRSIDRWFGIPFETVRRNADAMLEQVASQAQQRTLDDAEHLASNLAIQVAMERLDATKLGTLLAREVAERHLYAALCLTGEGRLLARAGGATPPPEELQQHFPAPLASGKAWVEALKAPWSRRGSEVFVAAEKVGDAGTIFVMRQLPPGIEQIAEQIREQARTYDELNRERKAVKRIYLSVLGLLTVLILFAVTWFAMFVSKQVTVPVQALAQATHEVTQGNLGFQIAARSDDELGSLIRLFNHMTAQLQESRQALEKAAAELQQANRQLEERSNTMEAILEHIPTGVISFDPAGRIVRMNSTVWRLLGRPKSSEPPKSLAELFPPEDAREIVRLFRQASRQGVVTRQLQMTLGTRRATVGLTLSSIRAQHGAVGSVLVIEDLTELLRAQRAAAWQEVAQRIAHEIKNPLTPIQLSAERIRRLMDREAGPPANVAATIQESASLIGREVATLKTLVDEFSDFARFPASQPVPSDLNAIVASALSVFEGRLDGIQVHRRLAPNLPTLRADPEQLKRALVNLIDNAAEALEHAPVKEIWVSTHADPDRDVAEISIADSGPGIPPEARERLFLPSFSTKRRGTGLGLAIVSRIVSEHHGGIRVEENQPSGTRFVIELPCERAAALAEA